MLTRTIPAWAIALVGLALVNGCSSEPRLYQVKGTVKFDNEPLPAGTVFFDPVADENKGPQGSAVIKNGEYDTSAAGGRGVSGGAYIMRIDGFDGKEARERPLGKALFTNYEKKLDLPKSDSVQNVDVPKGK